MTASPSIYGSQIRQAREALGLSLSDAARQLGVSGSDLDAWERGVAEPSVDELELLAAQFGRSVDYFLAARPERPAGVQFRTASLTTEDELPLSDRLILAEFEELCRFEFELEKLSGIGSGIAFDTFSVTISASELAFRQRVVLGLENRPIGSLRELLAKIGIKVFVLAVPSGSFAGLSWWHPTYGPAMLVNASDSPGRRNFTMAHEFGHLSVSKLNGLSICDLSDIESERNANRFAVDFLLPEDELRDYWHAKVDNREHIDVQVLGAVAQRYGVSLEALAIRLEELDLLSTALWIVKNSPPPRSFGRRRPDWRRTRGERFIQKAVKAHEQGTLSLGKLAEYLGTDLRSARNLIETRG